MASTLALSSSASPETGSSTPFTRMRGGDPTFRCTAVAASVVTRVLSRRSIRSMEASGGWVGGRRLVLSRTSARPGPEYSISTGPIGGDCHRPRARWQAPPASPPAVGQAGPVARSHQGPPTGGAPLSRPSRQSQERRGPGRPRSAEAHAAILAATLHLLIEQGFNGLTMEAVAARAGVGKATVYRRWPSKVPLVVEALRAAGEERVAVPASGSVEADLHQLLTDL